MRPPILLVNIVLTIALAACGQDEAAVATPSNTGPVAPADQAPTWEEKVEGARTKALAGDPAAALEATQALLAEKPEEDALWILVEEQTSTPAQAKEALDRLGAEPLGGRTGRHQILRAALALKAGMPAEAAEAAQAALAEEPDAAAALLAAAARAGASSTSAGGEGSPADALVRFASAANAKDAAPYAEAAGSVAGWRAAVLRGDVLAARGDAAGALAEYGKAADSGDPQAVVAGSIGRARLALSGKAGTAAEAATWASTAAKTALENAMTGLLRDALVVSAEASRAAMRPDEGLAALEPAFRRFQEAGNGAMIGEVGILLAEAALSAGKPVLAAEAAKAAREALAEGEATLRQDAAWQELLASWTLQRTEALKAAAGALEGPRKTLADALLLAIEGKPDTAAGSLKLDGLKPRAAVHAARAAALVQPDRAVPWLQEAVKAADKSGDRLLALSSRLALEEAARTIGDGVAARTRAELLKLAPEGEAGQGLRYEIAAREIAAGGNAGFGGASGPLGAWQDLAEGGPGAEAGAMTAAVSAWAKGRGAASTGDAAAAAHYNEALALLPLHRQGRLDAGTALDGSEGFNLEKDLDILAAGNTDAAGLASALAVHDVGHRLAEAREDLLTGRDPTVGLPEDVREGLLAAAARARAEVLRYQAGAGPLPVEAFDALLAAEKKAGETPVFKLMLPAPLPEVADLRTALDGAAILSYHVGPERVHGVALTSRGGAMRFLGKSSRVRELAGRHRAAMVASAGKPGKANHAAGNELRTLLVDPFMDDLSGFGRYLVVAPMAAFPFPFSTFPEQSDGLRWLAAIRTVASAPSLRYLRLPVDSSEAPEAQYKPDFFGLGAPGTPGATKLTDASAAAGVKDAGGTSDEDLLRRHRANSNLPPDLGSASRQFGDDFREIRVGADATRQSWTELAANARYIHIASVPAAEDGGFALSDGDLGLSALRSTPLRADLVIITAPAAPELQFQRARALLDAGARSVMVSAWEMPGPALDQLFEGFYEALNRDRPPAAAVREARESLLRSAPNELEMDDPGDWGALLLYSKP